jgi:hypothetical protein
MNRAYIETNNSNLGIICRLFMEKAQSSVQLLLHASSYDESIDDFATRLNKFELRGS